MSFLPWWFWIVEGFVVVLMIRNKFVHRERQRVIAEMGRLALEDIDAFREWFWRWEHFNAISYGRMLFSFKRVRSFYADSPTVREGSHDG